MTRPDVEATNWQAEQAIRLPSSRVAATAPRRGAATQHIVASVLRTAWQQDRDPLELLVALQRSPHPIVADFRLPVPHPLDQRPAPSGANRIQVVFIDPDPANPDSLTGPPPRVGRHVNGKLCFFPRLPGLNHKFVIADDTWRESCLDQNPPQARCSVTRRGSPFFVGPDPDGWAVFKRNGKWARRHIHTAWPGFSTTPLGMSPPPAPQGNIDP